MFLFYFHLGNVKEWGGIRKANWKHFFNQLVDILTIVASRIALQRQSRPPLNTSLMLCQKLTEIAAEHFATPLTISAQIGGTDF